MTFSFASEKDVQSCALVLPNRLGVPQLRPGVSADRQDPDIPGTHRLARAHPVRSLQAGDRRRARGGAARGEEVPDAVSNHDRRAHQCPETLRGRDEEVRIALARWTWSRGITGTSKPKPT